MRQAHIVDLDIIFNNEAHRKDMANFRVMETLNVKKASSYKIYGYPLDNAHCMFLKDPRGRVVVTINMVDKTIFIHRYEFKQFKVKKSEEVGLKIFNENSVPVIFEYLKEPFKVVDIREDKRVIGSPTHHYYQIYPRKLVSHTVETSAPTGDEQVEEELVVAIEQTSQVIKEIQSKKVSKMAKETKTTKTEISDEDKITNALKNAEAWESIPLTKENRDVLMTVTPKGQAMLGIDCGKRNPIWIASNSQLNRLGRGLAWCGQNPNKVAEILGKAIAVDGDDEEEYIFS